MVLVTGNWRIAMAGLAASLLIFGVLFFTVIQPSQNTANQAIKTGLQQSQQALNQASKQLTGASTQTSTRPSWPTACRRPASTRRRSRPARRTSGTDELSAKGRIPTGARGQPQRKGFHPGAMRPRQRGRRNCGPSGEGTPDGPSASFTLARPGCGGMIRVRSNLRPAPSCRHPPEQAVPGAQGVVDRAQRLIDMPRPCASTRPADRPPQPAAAARVATRSAAS